MTQLFDRYVEAREGRLPVDSEELLRRAGDAAGELEARMRAYEQVQRLAEELGAHEVRPDLPATVGRFAILRLLGTGGLGRVFLAQDPALGRTVALKVLDPEHAVGPRERGFVLNEARSLARLEHPGVVRVFEVGDPQQGGPAYIAMEHVEGPSLAEVITELRLLRGAGAQAPSAEREPARALALDLEPYTARVRCLARLAQALAYCHDRGVVHRDVKPANVLFDGAGRPKLLDFGLAHHASRDSDARIDVTERLYATPAYAAPEQIESGRTGADPRSDIFSLGVLAYELLALSAPFARKTRHLTLESVRRAEAPPLQRFAPGLPPDVALAVQHCLERDPARRYPSAEAFSADLEAILEHRTISVARPSGARRLGLWARRHRRPLVALGLAALLVGLTVVVAGISDARARWVRLTQGLETLVGHMGTRAPSTQVGDGGWNLRELHRIGDELLSARATAVELDRTRTQRWLFGASLPHVEQASLRWSELLAECIAADEERSGLAGVPFQWPAWKELVALDGRASGGPAYRLYGKRGGLELDPSLADLGTPVLYAQAPLGSGFLRVFPVYRPVEAVTYPVAGSYRVIVWDEGDRPVREQEVLQRSGWDPFRAVLPAPPDPTLFPTARRFERSTRSTSSRPDGESGQEPELIVPAFRLTEIVSVARYRAYLAATGQPQSLAILQHRDPEVPAYVNWGEAQAFCDWSGGRLPSALELAAAQAQGLELVDGPLEYGEWVVDADPASDQAAQFRYWNFHDQMDSGPRAWVALAARDVHSFKPLADPALQERTGLSLVGISFRVAYTDDERAVFETLPAIR